MIAVTLACVGKLDPMLRGAQRWLGTIDGQQDVLVHVAP
jgi:hypothetical protein